MLCMRMYLRFGCGTTVSFLMPTSATRKSHIVLPCELATPLNIVARRFREADILPSWHGLQKYATPTARDVSLETLEICGSRLVRDPERRYMHTDYDDHGPAVMWFGSGRGSVVSDLSSIRRRPILGCEVLFYVNRVIDGTCTAVTNVDLPASHRQLPHWVLPLLEEQLQSDADRDSLVKHVDAYLRMFREASVSPAVKCLRRINWACLPLHWQPAYLRSLPIRISRHESLEAQARLMKNVQCPNDTPETVSGAVALLARITGVDEP